MMMTVKKRKDMSEIDVRGKIMDMGFNGPKKQEGTFGIEIETETKDASAYPEGFFKEDTSSGHLRYRLPMDEWEGHVDNSLRNFGMEFVLRSPLSYDNSMKALTSFEKGTSGVKFIQNAPSTSVHVHVNMLPELPTTVANFLAIYTLFENVLVDYSGESRRSNLFALPIRVASATIDNMCDTIKMFQHNDHSKAKFNPSYVKYAALNLATLTTYGSLELRSFRGETDVQEIKDWLSIVNRIYTYAKTPGLTPRIVLFEYKMRGVSYLEEIFREMTDKIRSRVNDISELMDRNLWYLYKIATVTDDWEVLNIPKKKEEPKKKRATVEDYMALAGNQGPTLNWD